MNKQKEKEIWKPVKDFEGIYEVSNRGRVKAVKREITTKDGRHFSRPAQILSQHKNQSGIHRVNVSINGRMTQLQVPEMVLEAFDRPRKDGRVTEMARFKDGNRSNNHIDNLEWMPRPGFKGKAKECIRGHKFVPANLEKWAIGQGKKRCLACARARTIAFKNGRGGDKGYTSKIADREYLRILETMDDRDLY